MFQKANITKDQHLEFQDENISVIQLSFGTIYECMSHCKYLSHNQ